MPITLQEKEDKEIDKLLAQGHIQKLEEFSAKTKINNYFSKKLTCSEIAK